VDSLGKYQEHERNFGLEFGIIVRSEEDRVTLRCIVKQLRGIRRANNLLHSKKWFFLNISHDRK
jgi:hypothetical protein